MRFLNKERTMSRIDKYIGEAKQYTGAEQMLAKEIMIWSDSLKWAAEQLKKAEYDNTLKSLKSTKHAVNMLFSDVKKMQKELAKGNVYDSGTSNQKYKKRGT
jgi:hypothetical protein